MARSRLSKYIVKSRIASRLSVLTVAFSIALLCTFLFLETKFLSSLGTMAAVFVASIATFSRAHYRTQKFVRFAIRSRLANNSKPELEKLTRQAHGLSKYAQYNAHPSSEIKQALREAESHMGMKPGSVLALVVPMELLLGVVHNCPSAAAMLYAGRHPVILIDDELQKMLDKQDDFNKSYETVVSVFCHEIAHLIGWNTRWSKFIGICELFITTISMASLVVKALEDNVKFGLIGTAITCLYLAFEPWALTSTRLDSVFGIISRLSFSIWFPYLFIGIVLGFLPFFFVAKIFIVFVIAKYLIASFRRKEELYADAMAVISQGTCTPLANFFRTLNGSYPNLWDQLFATHPPIPTRIKGLRKIEKNLA
ncbi:MAG: M48 family metalloprotease [Acidimicrobiia bacterium]